MLEDLREWIQEHPKFAIKLSVISLLILLFITAVTLLEGPSIPEYTSQQEWYYDLNTQTLFTSAKDQQPPIEAPSGPLPNGACAGVRAYVLTYVEEPNESERFIAFLQTTDPNIDPHPTRTDLWAAGTLIRRIEDVNWVPATSIEGRTIIREAFAPNDNGEQPYYYYP